MFKYYKYLLFIFINLEAHAGLWGLTHHSRAHCINNESITWWAGHNFQSRIIAYHNKNRKQTCLIDTYKQYTWRNAAVHWGEAPLLSSDEWSVYAYHILYFANGMSYTDQITYVENCDIYTGWWD